MFILASLGYFIYLFWPYDISKVTKYPLNKESTHLTISVHGVKDSPANWSTPLKQIMLENSLLKSQHINLDWRPFSDNPLICSVVAKNIGEAIAKRIANETNVTSIHAIGHSCGSFMIYSLCNEIKKTKPEIKVHTTYLDPVSIYAGIFWDYGVNNFGSCADFSDAYIDTGDTVPGSNVALKNAFTFDVTQVRIKQNSQESPHNWPPQYYIQAYKKGHVPHLQNYDEVKAKYKQGLLVSVE